MRKRLRMLIFIAIFGFMIGSALNVQCVNAEDGTDQENTEVTDQEPENPILTGWQKIDEKMYYYDSDGNMLTGLQTISGKKYYFDENTGVMLTGWQTVNGYKRYFSKTDGHMLTGFQTIDGKKYYLNSNGIRLTGWQTVNGYKRYFSKTDGHMLTGLQTIGGKKYYLNSNGIRLTGWRTVNGKKRYYSKTYGYMLTGWRTIDGKKYYLYSAGGRATGWTKINGKTYYFSTNGVLKVGKTNSVSSNATRLNGLIINKSGVCTTDGKTATNVMITLKSLLTKNITAAKMSSSLSDRKKVDALFKYLCSKCTYKHMAVNPYATTFSTSSAKTMLQTGKGNCYCYAAAFAYLVKAATNYETRVSYGVCRIKSGWGRGTYSHGWTEIKIGGTWKIFDVELYDRGSLSSRYSSGKTYSQMRSAGTYYSRYGYVNITL